MIRRTGYLPAITLAALAFTAPMPTRGQLFPPSQPPAASISESDDLSYIIERLREAPVLKDEESGCAIHALEYHGPTPPGVMVTEDITADYEDCAPIGVRDRSDRMRVQGLVLSQTEALAFAAVDYGADGSSAYDTVTWTAVDTSTGLVEQYMAIDGEDPLGFMPMSLRKIAGSLRAYGAIDEKP